MAANGKPHQPEDDPASQAVYTSIPKAFWVKWTGRAYSTIDRQSRLYGCPLIGATISLPEFAKWFHDFIASKGRRLLKSDDSKRVELDLALRGQQLKLRQIEIAEREGKLVDAAKQMELLRKLAQMLRGCGEQLRQQYGPGALEILDDCLDSFEALLAQVQEGGE